MRKKNSNENTVVNSDSVSVYLKEISKYRVFTESEERKCAEELQLIKDSKIVNKKQINLIDNYTLKIDVILNALVNNSSYDIIVNKLINFFNSKCGKDDQNYYQLFKKYKEYSIKVNRSLNVEEIKNIFKIDYYDSSKIHLQDEVDNYLKYRNAYEKMFTSNLKLVVSIVKKFIPLMDVMDLISEGNIGLMKAIDHYDVNLGYKFSTYATWWIRQGIKRGIDNQKYLIRRPVHYSKELTDFRKSVEHLETVHKKTLTKHEISKLLNIPLEKVERYFLNMNGIISLNQPAGEDIDGIDLINFIESDEDIDEQLDCRFLKNDVINLIDIIKNMEGFDERSIEILKMRYGLWEYNNNAKTYAEIAEKLGMTSDLVRSIEMKTLRKIRYQVIVNPKLKSLRGYLK